MRVGGKVLVSKLSSKLNDIRTGQDVRPHRELGARAGRVGKNACAERVLQVNIPLPLGSYRLGNLPKLSHMWFIYSFTLPVSILSALNVADAGRGTG